MLLQTSTQPRTNQVGDNIKNMIIAFHGQMEI